MEVPDIATQAVMRGTGKTAARTKCSICKTEKTANPRTSSGGIFGKNKFYGQKGGEMGICGTKL